ncbi:MAG: hypothetical protein Q8L81_11195 [Bacteroidota bacterium]|nr:hypothetical protein [Bacteroidota bacterium]
MKAFKLINTNNTDCSFLEGEMTESVNIDGNHFVIKTDFDPYQLTAHPAPRYQFVITVKGKLRFKVTNGDTFIIEPGILLIAKDLKGNGHSWEIIDGNQWERIYIVPDHDADDFFVAKEVL